MNMGRFCFSHHVCNTRRLASLALLAMVVLLAACSKHESSTATALSKVDACGLVSAAMVAKYSSNLGAGHKGKNPIPNVSTCVWSDHAHPLLPALMLTVSPVDPAGVAKGLTRDMGKMGYHIVRIQGLGDEAAVSIQTPNKQFHTKAGVAILEVRVGKRQFGYSPVRPPITGTDTPAFAKLKQLAADTAANLGAHHNN